MRVDKTKLEQRLRRKAAKSRCHYAVVAVGLDDKGNVIGITSNTPRLVDKRDWHAEERLIFSSPPSLSTIYIARFGKTGIARPIHPCRKCKALADKRGIKIRRFHDDPLD